MIELYELRQLQAFADTGTLSDAAESLHLSQPALSRNMKKLEEELEIPIFERSKNKLALSDNGLYVLDLARSLLTDADSLIVKARDYDRKNRTVTLGICSPAPAWILVPLITNHFPHASLQTEQDSKERLLADLDNNAYQLIALPEQPEGTQYCSKECGKESLMFSLPKGHKYAHRKKLTFTEMNGENMLLMPDIGFWSFVKDKMPDSRFLTQSDRFSFNELVQASTLPSFITNLSEQHRQIPEGRNHIPIADKEATVTYYLVCKAEHQKAFRSLFQAL